MSDRLAVMRAGRLEQVGAPREVYDEPASAYVADFLGLANLVSAEASADGVAMLGARLAATTGDVRGTCTVLVRPERVRLAAAGAGSFDATVEHVVFAGAFTHVHLRVGEVVLQAVVPNSGHEVAVSPGASVGVGLTADSLRVLADQSASAIR